MLDCKFVFNLSRLCLILRFLCNPVFQGFERFSCVPSTIDISGLTGAWESSPGLWCKEFRLLNQNQRNDSPLKYVSKCLQFLSVVVSQRLQILQFLQMRLYLSPTTTVFSYQSCFRCFVGLQRIPQTFDSFRGFANKTRLQTKHLELRGEWRLIYTKGKRGMPTLEIHFVPCENWNSNSLQLLHRLVAMCFTIRRTSCLWLGSFRCDFFNFLTSR